MGIRGKRKRLQRNSKSLSSKEYFSNETRMEDRIGKLSDDILGVTVSHLTLKEAARTSVLSRRWKNLWTLAPRLNFDAGNQSRSEIKEYMRWVKKVVENCRSADLDEFSIVCDCPLDSRHYQNLDECICICIAVNKQVKAISIKLWPNFKAYSFIKSAPRLPGIKFLTSLCLKQVNIDGKMMKSLLASCPLLEKFSLEDSKKLSKLEVVGGSSLKLKVLHIVFCNRLQIIVIDAPNLLSFHYFGRDLELQVSDVSSLVDLSIGSYLSIMDNLLGPFSVSFFHLKALALSFFSYEMFFKSVRQTELENLKHLTLQFWPNRQHNLLVLSQFINFFPLLHRLTLKLHKWSNTCQGEMEEGSGFSHQYLREVEITGLVVIGITSNFACFF